MFRIVRFLYVNFSLCLLLLSLSGCSTSNAQRVKAAETERDRIRQNLYVPTQAILLGVTEKRDVLPWAPDCVRASVEIVYGIDRPFVEIVEEYRQTLLLSDWELSSLYKNEEIENFYYKNGPKVILSISDNVIFSLPTSSLSNQQFETIYSVFIRYEDPSIADCIP